MTKYAYEYGKRWNVETPRAAIKRRMARLHVSTPESEIEAMIGAAVSESKDKHAFTPSIIRECVAYALICHRGNVALYEYVMRHGKPERYGNGAVVIGAVFPEPPDYRKARIVYSGTVGRIVYD